MSWRTNPIVLRARNVGRVFGMTRLVARFDAAGYEDHYDALLSACIRPGDVVWDIGANVGYYTKQFSRLAGEGGRVVAFEPSPTNFARLQTECNGLSNIILQACALGKTSGQLRFHQGDDVLGATSRIVEDNSATDVVTVQTGDELISTNVLPPPNVIKMDVEGYEAEVLGGMTECVESPRLRAVGVEVHFGILAYRGLGQAPRDIESTLKAAGFKVAWPDRSHLLAIR